MDENQGKKTNMAEEKLKKCPKDKSKKKPKTEKRKEKITKKTGKKNEGNVIKKRMKKSQSKNHTIKKVKTEQEISWN